MQQYDRQHVLGSEGDIILAADVGCSNCFCYIPGELTCLVTNFEFWYFRMADSTASL